jgi:hypothetical protein
MIVLTILIAVLGYAISWAISVGLMYLICLCFSWDFNLLIATGIWLVGVLVKGLFSRGGNK